MIESNPLPTFIFIHQEEIVFTQNTYFLPWQLKMKYDIHQKSFLGELLQNLSVVRGEEKAEQFSVMKWFLAAASHVRTACLTVKRALLTREFSVMIVFEGRQKLLAINILRMVGSSLKCTHADFLPLRIK